MTLRIVAALAALLLLATVPLWIANGFYINIVSQILIYAILALGLNILVGYGGLVSLGHAGLMGVAAYTAAWLLSRDVGQLESAAVALLMGLAAAAIYAALSLRATGIGFLMITLSLGQILWGTAYRWISLTNGDNGISISTRPAPFGLSLASATGFYYFTLLVFVLAILSIALFVHSPLGASLRGARDQPRRMTALGFNVWLIRFFAFLFSGFWSGVSGLLYCYYQQFVSPQMLALPASAEALLMVISGGTGTLLGPVAGAALVVVMKNVASAYIERWNLLLGVIFVAIIVLMPEGLVPGSVRLWRWIRAQVAGAPAAAAKEPAP
jgi:branched-chain amino acid transport system permease protein